MNRNFTLCNDAPEAPGGFDTFGTPGMSGAFGTSAALKGSAAARFGIAPAKTDNPLSVSEIRGGGGGKPLICSELRLRKNNFPFSTHESRIQFRLGTAFFQKKELLLAVQRQNMFCLYSCFVSRFARFLGQSHRFAPVSA